MITCMEELFEDLTEESFPQISQQPYGQRTKISYKTRDPYSL